MSAQTEPTPLPDVLEAIRSDPENGRLHLAVTGALLDGLRCRAEARGHERVVLIGPEAGRRYRELANTVDRHCPVLDIVGNWVPVERVIETRAAQPA
jgi:hypothetical protein